MIGVADKIGTKKSKNTSSWISLEAKFILWGIEVAQELDLRRIILV
jgi:hypothetical protein